MDVFITEIDTGARLALSLLPERIRLGGESKFQVYDLIGRGDIKIPNGTSLLQYSWECILPGAGRLNSSFVKRIYWRSPSEIINLFESWRNNGTRLRLLVTETPINKDVYLETYNAEAAGGNGDYTYSISFVEDKQLLVYDVTEVTQTAAATANVRPPAAAASSVKTYTVKSGDCLWNIAQKYLGKGSRYMEIYNLNTDKIKNPRLIYAGQVLTMPA